MTEVDEYIIRCIEMNKKPSGKRIFALKNKGLLPTLSDEHLYAEGKKTEIPYCAHCNKNKVSLISFAKGFRKFCSKECYSVVQSKRNSENNAIRNVNYGKEKTSRYTSSLEMALSDYNQKTMLTVKEIADNHNLPLYALRKFILDRNGGNKIPKERGARLRKAKMKSKTQHIDVFLDDFTWLSKQQKNGKTTSMVADDLGCSSNYVATKSRDLGVPFPNNRSTSSYEMKMKDFLESIGQTVLSNTRKILDGMEIDLFLPESNIGIEINGVYWHQYQDKPNSRIDRLYHKRKTDLAEQKGIRLLHLFDYELMDDRKMRIIESIVSCGCGKNIRIYAKDCRLKEIDSTTYKNFLDDNHVKGSISSKVKIGLFYKEDLVMVAGFSKPRFNKNHEWELIRLCSKVTFTVVGGATKIFSNFIKLYRPKSVISYCDRRFFTGKVYEKMGMRRIDSNEPNYVWVKNLGKAFEVISRYKSQKHKISDSTNKNMTEDEIMRQNKYMKVYDSGQHVFVWEDSMVNKF
jgi:hypothetical protein